MRSVESMVVKPLATVFEERPVLGTLGAAAVAALFYLGITVVRQGQVRVLEAATFGVVFAVVYVSVTRYVADGKT